MQNHLLNIICFLPLIAVFFILIINKKHEKTIRWTALLFSFLSFVLSCCLLYSFDAIQDGLYKGFDKNSFFEAKWIDSFYIYYRVCVDKLSVLLLILTGLLTTISTIVSFNIKKDIKLFYALLMILLFGMNGVFLAEDLFLFYVFWEIMLLPMYFLIGIWGGDRGRYAAIKFFIYTLFGSVLILIAVLAVYYKMKALGFEGDAFNIAKIIEVRPFFNEGAITFIQYFLFILLFIGFAIKLPVFPFHTWLPDAHVEAPTAISVLLAGVLLKMGAYGILRINFPFFPEVAASTIVITVLAILGIINILYGACCAFSQSDFKRLVAFSSVSHMGYVLLGICVLKEEAINGAIFQIFSHGITASFMFILVGVLYDRAHHREILKFGGIASVMPKYFAFAMVGFFASLGLPGLIGFIGEFLTFLGVFEYSKIYACVAAIGMILTSAYILLTIQRVYLGKEKQEYKDFSDVNICEKASLYTLSFLAIIFGIFPSLLINEYLDFIKAFKSIMGL